MIEDLVISLAIILFFTWLLWMVARLIRERFASIEKIKLAEAEARKYEAAQKLTDKA
jgi:flagellar biogenesis protein FliO